MRRSTVIRYQEQLRKVAQFSQAMPPIAVDGIYGDSTKNAMAAFQQLSGLKPTGEPDYETIRRLDEVYDLVTESTNPPLSILPPSGCDVSLQEGDETPTVSLVEVMLNALADIYPSLNPVPVNGVFDAETVAVVCHFQRINALEPNGRLDKRTWNAMVRLYNSAYGWAC